MKSITADQLKMKIALFCKLKNPKTLLVFGDAGIGKTYSIEEVAKEQGRKYYPFSLGRMESFDLKGVPKVMESSKYTEFIPPLVWKEIQECGGNAIVHFDEFTLAAEDVQGGVLDIILNKKVDNEKLPDKTLFILSGNMGGNDGTFAKATSSAIINRGFTYRMIPPLLTQWLKKHEHLLQNSFKTIEAFLKGKGAKGLYLGPNLAEPFEPWTSPRAWTLLLETANELKLDLTKDEDIREFVTLASAILSSSTVNALEDHLADKLINIDKFLAMDDHEWARYQKADPAKRSFTLGEVCDRLFQVTGTGTEQKKIVKDRTEILQKVITKLEKAEPVRDILSGFFGELGDRDCSLYEHVIFEDKALGKFFDVLDEKKRDSSKGKK